MRNEFEPGRVVQSIAGHDKGTLYVVTACVDGRTILVTDGKYHPTCKIKKKNKKHVVTKGHICGTIKDACMSGDVLDAEIRKFLRTLNKDDFHKEES